MNNVQEKHRPTSFKQTNKQHKHGKHRSKGMIEASNKGKINVKTITKKPKHLLKREERRNQSNQIRLKKREEVLNKKRNLGTANAAPFLISIVPLTADAKINLVLNALKEADPESVLTFSDEANIHISVPRFKQRFTFILPKAGDLFSNLDALKISDTVIFVMSALGEGIDEFGENLLTTILAQGLPSTITAITELDELPLKKRNDCKHNFQKMINKWIPEEKIINIEKASDGLLIFRKIGSQKQRNVYFRDRRSHLIAEKSEYENDILKITGFIRGQPLSANSLVHIPGWGNFQIDEIHSADDNFGVISRQSNLEDTLLMKADPEHQESLETECIPDPFDGEQTWPTEEELKMAEKNKIKVKKIPKGMSEYQAAWIPDWEEESEEDLDEEYDEAMNIDEAMKEDSDSESKSNDEDYDMVTVTDAFPKDEQYDEKVDYDEEKELLDKLQEANTDAKWPDEVDTPLDIPARERFQKYRGLKSFRTSPWDQKENLPRDYARIFQFENFDRARRIILKDSEKNLKGISPGEYVRLHIKNVSKHLYDSRPRGQPLVVFEMLSHEQRMSVIHFVLRRPTSDKSQLPIKSKEQLIFHCGYRRFKAGPIFSQHTNGTKHKFERFFQTDSTVVASVFAPIIFPPCHVLAFQESGNGNHKLIATGSVLTVNPDRIIAKRVVLSGHPFKVHKKSAVIRFMFFNKEDIDWFKPIELRTRYGRRGHIKESLGTHGHMKCIFDGQLKSQDTIFLNLYKRIFPKWNYEPFVTRPINEYNDDQMMIQKCE